MNPCNNWPEKVQFPSLVDALDELQRRFRQPHSRVKRPYKCPFCYGWHFTSRSPHPVSTYGLFPVYYYVVRNAGGIFWQSNDQRTAERYSRLHPGSWVEPKIETRKKRLLPSD